MAGILSSFMCYFLFALREGIINRYRESQTGGVFPLKILSVSVVRGERASRVVSPKRKEVISQLEVGEPCG